MIDINLIATVISLLFMLAGGIYQLAKIEANINSRILKLESNLLTAIDVLKDNLVHDLYKNQTRLDVHLTEYNEKKIFVEYRLNALESLIKHKFERLAGWTKQIAELLYNQCGFQIKDDRF